MLAAVPKLAPVPAERNTSVPPPLTLKLGKLAKVRVEFCPVVFTTTFV